MAGASNSAAFDDLFSTIEEVGLTDIAKELHMDGLVRGGGNEEGVVGALMGLDGGDPSGSGLGADSQLSASGNGSQDPGASSPPTVHMPHCSVVGPSVPQELQELVGSGGEPASKKRKMTRQGGGKQGDKGLRHFSMKVCEKVEQKHKTTYNEVADELVAEFAASPEIAAQLMSGGDGDGKEGKRPAGGEAGIRRRVYDALNVLMAMDIITKEKKSILWKGLPTNSEQEFCRLERDLEQRRERTEQKRRHLQDLVTQQVSFKNLITRNQEGAAPVESRIALPFIVVNTRKETVIDCEMAEDKQEIFFNFSAPFEIHDDSETLKRMNMQRCDPTTVAALVPEGMGPFAAEMLAAIDDMNYGDPCYS